ncbi:MAG: hypothetical protein ABI603_01725 [Acidobacteriota bacterium]
MAVTITVRRSFTVKLDTLKLTTKADMREIGLLARERIVTRTLAGQGVDGPFRPYSSAYAKRKGSSAVNLQVSGNMLNQLQIVDVTDTSVRLGWVQ